MKIYNRKAERIFSVGHALIAHPNFRWDQETLNTNFESVKRQGYINPYVEMEAIPRDNYYWTHFYGYLAPDFQI